MLAQDIPVGKPVVITYVDSEPCDDGHGTILKNDRRYLATINEVKPVPVDQKHSKAKGFISDTLLKAKTHKGFRQFYNGRIVSCRRATIVERVKAALGLFE